MKKIWNNSNERKQRDNTAHTGYNNECVVENWSWKWITTIIVRAIIV